MSLKSILKKVLSPVKPIIKGNFLFDVYSVRRRIAAQNARHVGVKFPKTFIFYKKNRVAQYAKLFKSISIDVRENVRFQHWIDEDVFFINRFPLMDLASPPYQIILESSIYDLVNKNKEKKNKVEKNNFELLKCVEAYVNRIVSKLSSFSNEQVVRTKNYFERMLNSKADSLEEALQRILFWSSIFWQTGHTLIGFGRLDKILAPYVNDLSEKEMVELLKDFLIEVHRYYAFKSNSLMGDTGQIIILGGKDSDGHYFCNALTYGFINAIEEIRLPDPKILLRVSEQMPLELLCKAAECNATGIGCPLLSNDDIIIPALQNFGYSHKDACNYITSACWEPFCYGNSFGKLNLGTINYAQALSECLNCNALEKTSNFEDVFDLYTHFLEKEVLMKLAQVDAIKWDVNPLMSMFTDGCAQSGKDISEGGAIHSDYGLLTVGLANVVNSLLNFKYFVFDQKIISIQNIRQMVTTNFAKEETLRQRLSDSYFWGRDENLVLDLISRITEVVKRCCLNYRNRYCGKIKVGYSSPMYMEAGAQVGALLDGRKAGLPLSVHISSKLGEPYTELVNFAGKLKYDGFWSNGSVVDFFVSPSFIKNNLEKFCSFLYSSIKIGFFQMQMNVVSSKTLIDAKDNPELYPNLIVRVWGFSAYFKDLPGQYQDLLIQRAIECEMTV